MKLAAQDMTLEGTFFLPLALQPIVGLYFAAL
jgi:hypothetical protein